MAFVIKVADASITDQRVGDRGFMFEEMWTKHEDYERMITEAWELGSGPISDINGLWRRLQEMSKNMKKWSFETFGSVKAELKKLRAKLDSARAEALIYGSSLEVKGIELKLHDLYEKEEIMFRQ
jgi:hypothetical protein